MAKTLQGIKVLEVAQYIFVPSSGAILSEWGADVIKIEHPIRGDAQRGMNRSGGVNLSQTLNPLIEHANRGKTSIGLDISTTKGLEILYKLVSDCDVFLTNYLPSARSGLKIDVEHIRAANPNIIYVRGSAHGDKGPERDVGGFDFTSFWTRSGIAYSITPGEYPVPLMQGIGGFGDSISGMNIVAGVCAALFHRDRTGEPLEIDVSLMSSAWWAAGAAMNTVKATKTVTRNSKPAPGSSPNNPLIGYYKTSDDRVINLFTIQADKHIENLLSCLDLSDLIGDERFNGLENLIKNANYIGEIISEKFGERSLSYWRDKLRNFKGQWSFVQSFEDFLEDDQALANDMLINLETPDGKGQFGVVRGPVQFNKTPSVSTRAPQHAEHTETILLNMGLNWEDIGILKAESVIS